MFNGVLPRLHTLVIGPGCVAALARFRATYQTDTPFSFSPLAP